MASSLLLRQPLWKKLIVSRNNISSLLLHLPAAASTTVQIQRGNTGMYAFSSSSSVSSSSSFAEVGFEEWLSRHRKSYNTPEEKERLFRSFNRKQRAIQKKEAFREKRKAMREQFAGYGRMQGCFISIREGEDDYEETIRPPAAGELTH